MLGLRWIAAHAGAPDSPEFRAADDRIMDRSGKTVLQEVPKSGGRVTASDALKSSIRQWSAGLKGRAAVIMVHGYSYDPTAEYDPGSDDDAFNRVYANPAVERYPLESWLPIVGETSEDGEALNDIALGFCWTSTGSLSHYAKAGWSNSYQYAVLDLAVQAAKSLELIVQTLREEGVKVDFLAHSLGTRLTLRTLSLLADHGAIDCVRRVVLLGGAEFSVDALHAVGKGGYDVFNLVNRHDEVLQWGAAKMIHPFRYVQTAEARVIGRDGMKQTDRWIDIQIDRSGSNRRASFDQWFQGNFHTTLASDGAGGRGRHWGYYMQPGNRAFLRQLFADPALGAAEFRNRGLIDGVVRYAYGELPDKVPVTPQTLRERLDAVREASAVMV
ncbi:alpha/beta hydrolase [Azospirillum ramasamyi]|nr:alpha/beta hydrolase [Azospirillum ramasamyi]